MSRFCFIGAGAVGGYYAAMLARAGTEVSVIARGAHLEAIRSSGLRIESEAVGDFTARVGAESDPARVGPVDVVVLAVKTYDNPTALPMIAPLLGADTVVLTLQNGVDSPDQVAEVAGRDRTLAGPTYIATAIEAPGVIRQTGSHRRIVFGEYFDPPAQVSPRVRAIETLLEAADIHAEAVADARIPVWEKFTYLAPFAAFTGAARLPIGPIWADAGGRAAFLQAVAEVESVARAGGVPLPPDAIDRISKYVDGIPASTRSSLLIDLSQGKRIEVESLPGSVVRRGQSAGVATPMMAALYAVLKPHAAGAS
ncbi:MAG TPA: 2-dehydropantoate 2-reductase [Vicinamibacterales bacterium]|nr:2-dehydropantoate 2-reductase [Vicinamibacterales bacterium]